MYPPEFKEYIAKIELTRAKRLKEDYPKCSEEDRFNLIKQYHPNFVGKKICQLRLGPNKGDYVPEELAGLLEGDSLVDPDVINLEELNYDVDVLVIGGGGAGLAAALSAHESGLRVLLVTKLSFIDSDTIRFHGGIQAATSPNDSPLMHYLDTIIEGDFANIPELVETMACEAPFIIKWLESLGCIFDKETDGKMKTEFGEGTSRKRVHHAKGRLGLEIIRNLWDEVCNNGIPVLEYFPAIELIMDDKGQVAGAILINLETKKEVVLIRSKTVVFATGGDGQLHYQGFPSIDHYGATADGLVMAYRVGAKLLLSDIIQFTPTGIIYPSEMVGDPIDTKALTLGAKLINVKAEQFVNHLEGDDVITSAIIREYKNGLSVKTPKGLNGIWLDIPMIDIINGSGTIQKEFPLIYKRFKTFGIDIGKDPVLVYPSHFYSFSGIKIDSNGATSVKNLYAAGKICSGIHGKHLLKDNLLLDVLVFGRRAGKAAANRAKEVKLGKLTLDHIIRWKDELKKIGLKIQSQSPKLIPDYFKYKEVIRPDWLRYERFEARKDVERPRLQPVDVKKIELILKEVIDISAPPVARARLLSQRGLSSDNRLDIIENVVGSKTCLGCGNCNDVCPILVREPQRRERTEERTSMALESVLLDPEQCDRCYACILACPQVDVTIKYYIVNHHMVDVMSWLASRIGDKNEPDLDLFLEETLYL